MPAKKKSAETTEIKVTSKLTFQLNDRMWYSVESSRNRVMNGLTDEEVDIEQDKLWESVGSQVDKQVVQAVEPNVDEPTWKKVLEIVNIKPQ